jgi:hypothetical protein
VPRKGVINLGLIGRQKRFSRACREGTTGTKAVTSSARRGALAMWDVAAWITYHSAPANVNIGPCDTVAQPPAPRASNDRLRHQRTVPLRFVCRHRRSDRQLQHCGVLTFAQPRQ